MIWYQTRGNEWAYMVEPRFKKLSILGLGRSIGTNKVPLTAPVIVVNSFKELKTKQIQGKIVVYNFNFTSYGDQVVFREQGATEAAKYGAVATLVMCLHK